VVLAPLLKALDIWAGLAATKTERFPSLARTLAAMETLAGLLDMLNHRMQHGFVGRGLGLLHDMLCFAFLMVEFEALHDILNYCNDAPCWWSPRLSKPSGLV
jgi:hypothetical protein